MEILMLPRIKILFTLILGILACSTAQEINTTRTERAIGTRQYIWEDSSRIDAHYGGSRILNIQIWYPADSLSGNSGLTPYLLFEDQLVNRLNGWNAADFRSLKRVKTASFINAIPAVSAKTPLLIFSPSLGGNLSFYTYYAERFAREGYIVMGVNHRYDSEVVIDRESVVHQANHSFYDSLKALEIPQQITAEGYRKAMGQRQLILAEDLLFALNKLLKEALFQNIIDKKQIGVFGHSIGGAAAIYTSLLDTRIRAVIDLDGTPPSEALGKGIGVPFLFIEDLTDYRNLEGYAKMHRRRSEFCERNSADSWRILIDGINHNSFLDIDFYMSEDSGVIRTSHQSLESISSNMIRFFDFNLRGAKDLNFEKPAHTNCEIIHFQKN